MNNRNEIEKNSTSETNSCWCGSKECADNTLIFNASGIVVKL